VTSTGWTGNAKVEVWLHSTPMLLTTVRADADGHIRSLATIPLDAPTGSHTVVLVGTGADGDALELRAAVEIRVPPPPTDAFGRHDAPLGQVLLFTLGAAFLALAVGVLRKSSRSTT
jgi:hypothetical protein